MIPFLSSLAILLIAGALQEKASAIFCKLIYVHVLLKLPEKKRGVIFAN